MAANPSPHLPRSTGLVIMFFAYYAYLGMSAPYLSSWLTAVHLDIPIIAVSNAMVALAATVGQIIFPAMALRSGLKKISIWAVAGALASTAILLLPLKPLAILLLLGVTSFCSGALIPLADAHAVTHYEAYGRVRAIGSAGFATASIVGGWMIETIGPMTFIPIECGLLALLLAGCLLLPATPIAKYQDRHWEWQAIQNVICNGRLWLVIAAVALINASHAYYYTFGALGWHRAQGLNYSTIGWLWALGVFSEIITLLLLRKVTNSGSALALIMLGAVCAVVRWAINADAPSVHILLMLQLLHGMTFGATLLGGILLVRQIADERSRNFALGLFAAIVHGVGLGALTLALGSPALHSARTGYWLMAVSGAMGLAVTILLTRRSLGKAPAGASA